MAVKCMEIVKKKLNGRKRVEHGRWGFLVQEHIGEGGEKH